MNLSALNDDVQIILEGDFSEEPITIDPDPDGNNLVEIRLLPAKKKGRPFIKINIKPKVRSKKKK